MNSGEDYYALGSEVAEISSWRKKRLLRGYGYLYTFGMVEEFICLLCSTTSVQEHTDRIKFFLIGCRFDRPPFDLLVEKQILREIKQCDS